jgi:hypothetical protein
MLAQVNQEKDLRKAAERKANRLKQRIFRLRAITGQATPLLAPPFSARSRRHAFAAMKKKLLRCAQRVSSQASKETLHSVKLRLHKQAEVQHFFEENSTASAGKKDVKSIKNLKYQLRYLHDSVERLYAKYGKENANPVSQTVFRQLRPKFIVQPNVTGRETTGCKLCYNIKLLASGMRDAGLMSNKPVDIVAASICPSPRSASECYHGCCPNCPGFRCAPPNTPEKVVGWTGRVVAVDHGEILVTTMISVGHGRWRLPTDQEETRETTFYPPTNCRHFDEGKLIMVNTRGTYVLS